MKNSVLVGLMGRGIAASLSPRLHESEARAQGFSLIYRLIDFEQLRLEADQMQRVFEAAALFGFDGFNVTHPFKQVVIPLLDALSPEARAIGSVNTVTLSDGRRVGHNTDAYGFLQGLRASLGNSRKERVTQLGAGGAGFATAYALLEYGVAELGVYDVDAERAHKLVRQLQHTFPERSTFVETDVAAALLKADGLVQATPIGMVGHEGMPIEPQWLRAELWVAEVIYFPAETLLLKAARARGCRTIDGTRMVVHQAARAFELFTGRMADAERMRAAFEAARG